MLSDVPIVEIDGIKYFEFLLDINQTNNNPLVSLNELKLYTTENPNVTGLIDSASFTSDTTLVWDLDDQNVDGTDDTDNTILLDYDLQAGSGKSDMFFYVPITDFGLAPTDDASDIPDGTYVVLYSEFGATGDLDATDGGNIDPLLYGDYSSNDGFEEWAVSKEIAGPTISGYKWIDLDGDGNWDDGEQGSGGWKIDYTLTYKDGNGANAPIVEIIGSVTTSDGSTDANGDGVIDAMDVGYYEIPIPLGAANNTTYTLTLTEVNKDETIWVNSYDGDATPDETTTFMFDENTLTGDVSIISGDFGATETMNFGKLGLRLDRGHQVRGCRWRWHHHR